MGLSRAYWEGAAEGRLVLQRCVNCGTVRHYPRVICPVCQSFGVDSLTASGRGTIHSWTVSSHAFSPAFADQVPYALVTVDMEEGVRVLGRLAGDPSLELGLPVRLEFRADPEGRPLPWFTAEEQAP